MGKKRVECSDCAHFVEPVFRDDVPGDEFSCVIKEKAKCGLGKMIRFRMPKINQFDLNWGWVRYCDEFKKKEKNEDSGRNSQ